MINIVIFSGGQVVVGAAATVEPVVDDPFAPLEQPASAPVPATTPAPSTWRRDTVAIPAPFCRPPGEASGAGWW